MVGRKSQINRSWKWSISCNSCSLCGEEQGWITVTTNKSQGQGCVMEVISGRAFLVMWFVRARECRENHTWLFFLHKFLLLLSYFLISRKCAGHSVSSCVACSSFIYLFQFFLGINNKTHTSNRGRSLRFNIFLIVKHKWIIFNSTFWRLKSIIYPDILSVHHLNCCQHSRMIRWLEKGKYFFIWFHWIGDTAAEKTSIILAVFIS